MILENKLGLTSSADLARAEERVSKKRASELFDCKLLDSFLAGKFETFQIIHKYLLEDIYDFAGEIAKNIGYKKEITWETIQNPYIPQGMVDKWQEQAASG
jgi:fido (protein-threonine AMPylation protein)